MFIVSVELKVEQQGLSVMKKIHCTTGGNKREINQPVRQVCRYLPAKHGSRVLYVIVNLS